MPEPPYTSAAGLNSAHNRIQGSSSESGSLGRFRRQGRRRSRSPDQEHLDGEAVRLEAGQSPSLLIRSKVSTTLAISCSAS